MKAAKRKFIINELMEKDFIEPSNKIIHLEETEEEGKSELDFEVNSEENLIIKNLDKKSTEIHFFNNDSKKSMFKRVDHIVFEHVSDNNWKLHLIEMKSSIFDKKWIEVKGKFRASYLLSQAIAAMLEMNIVDTCMYTTYENVHFSCPDTMPSSRRLPLGVPLIKPQEEWNGGDVTLNFGIAESFSHISIQMKRNEKNVLIGKCVCGI